MITMQGQPYYDNFGSSFVSGTKAYPAKVKCYIYRSNSHKRELFNITLGNILIVPSTFEILYFNPVVSELFEQHKEKYHKVSTMTFVGVTYDIYVHPTTHSVHAVAQNPVK